MEQGQKICEAFGKKKKGTYSEISSWRWDSECLIILKCGWKIWGRREIRWKDVKYM
jgi:hypothetical protein